MTSRLFIALITLYQRCISPFFGQSCRFYPSCSEYAKIAFHRFGAGRGMILSLRRLIRCHPWNPGGIDLVPDKE